MKTVSVTIRELKIASERWYELHGLKSIAPWHYLTFLGETKAANAATHSFWREIFQEIEVSEESARKIKQLNGPHYKTLLAIYKAQNMIE